MMSSTSRTWRPREVEVEVLHDAHDAARAGRAAIGRDRHEVELDRQIEIARARSAHEHERALEHADQQRVEPGVVGGDLRRRARAPVWRGRPLRPGLRPGQSRPGRGCHRAPAATLQAATPRPGARRAAVDAGAARPDARLRLGGDRLAPSHREHAIDRRGVRRVAVRRASARTARRARARRRRRTTRAASVGSIVGDSASSRSASSRSRSAWRASSARRHVRRCRRAAGSTSWRIRLRRKPQVVVRRVVHRLRCRAAAQSHRVSRRRRTSSGRRCRPHPSQAVEAGAAQQVEQHRLGLVVGGVAGEHVGRQARRTGPRAPGLRGSGRARP